LFKSWYHKSAGSLARKKQKIKGLWSRIFGRKKKKHTE
jgi:hypothetical protein